MKTTEDCINLLIQKYPETSEADWKRRSKKMRLDGSCHRIFENIKTHMWSNVYEFNDALTELREIIPPVFNLRKPPNPSKSSKSKYIYSLLTATDDEGADETENWDGILAVSLRKEFEREGCSSDYLDEDIYDTLSDIGLDGQDETHFAIPKGKLNQMRAALSSLPSSLILQSKEFTGFLKTRSSIYGWKSE